MKYLLARSNRLCGQGSKSTTTGQQIPSSPQQPGSESSKSNSIAQCQQHKNVHKHSNRLWLMTSIETPTYDTVEVTVGFAGGLLEATQKNSHTFQEACYSKKST